MLCDKAVHLALSNVMHVDNHAYVHQLIDGLGCCFSPKNADVFEKSASFDFQWLWR